MSVSIFDTAKVASEKDDQQYLRDIEDLKLIWKSELTMPQSELLMICAVNNTSFFLAGHFGGESYIPKHAQQKTKKFCTALIKVNTKYILL